MPPLRFFFLGPSRSASLAERRLSAAACRSRWSFLSSSSAFAGAFPLLRRPYALTLES